MMVANGTIRDLIDRRLPPRPLVIQGGRICPFIGTSAVLFLCYVVSGREL